MKQQSLPIPWEDAAQVNRPATCEEIAALALEFAALLMQGGASARNVHAIAQQIATGLKADTMDLRLGYASITISVHVGSELATRIRKLAPLGVNQALDDALNALAQRVERGELGIDEIRGELSKAVRDNKPRAEWVRALAVGIACTSFGRLLGVDWPAVAPILAASAIAQWIRMRLHHAGVNVFVSATIVAFVGSALCGFTCRLVGSTTVPLDMAASVLLLVPGVPSLNAQMDILEGRPTLGSARAVWVAVFLVFMAVGLWLAEGLLGVRF